MSFAISARRSLTGPLDPGRRPRRLGAFLAIVVVLIGLAMAVVASRPEAGRPAPGLADTAGSAELAAALGLQPPAPGVDVPRFTLRDVQGQAISAQDLQGKVVLMSFFATWCPSCQSEVPALRELAARFQGTDFVLLLVNYGEGRETVRPHTGELGFAHAILLDPGMRVGDSLGVKFLPSHFLIGRDGELVATGVGPKPWDGPAAVRLVGDLLRGRG